MVDKRRAIDANELLKYVGNKFGFMISKRELLQAIEMQPTMDAVEVVRCKDCKYYRESEHPERSGIKFCFRLMHPTENRHIGYNFSDDDFCSHGERKDEEG